MSRVQHTHSHVQIYCAHVDPFVFTIQPPSNRATPFSSPILPLRPRHTRLYHPLHQLAQHRDILEQIELQAKLLNYFLGSNKSNINQSLSLPLSAAACVLPCCCDLLWLLSRTTTAVGAAWLPCRECVPMVKARACVGGRSWQGLTHARCSRLGMMRVGTHLVSLWACPRPDASTQV